MSYPVSLLTLRTRVRQRSNLEGETGFITDTEVNDLINQAIALWYDLIVNTTWGGATYFKTYSFATVAQQSGYALPADWLHIESVDVFIAPGSNNNQVISARPYQRENRNLFRFWNVTWNYAYPIFYRVQGQTLNFIPTPPGQFNIALNYIATAPTLVVDGDTLDSINSWDEYIVLCAAIKCLTKTGQLGLIPALEAQLAREERRITAAAGSRDVGAAETVHDVTSDLDPYDG